jgi:hypothetical protein
MRRVFLLLPLVLASAALFAPSGAQAASCWQRLIDDWRDGRIDNVYPLSCYRDALAKMPEDLRVYGSAENDIQGALTRRLAVLAAERRRMHHAQPTTTTTDTRKTATRAKRSTPQRQRPTRSLAGSTPAPKPTLRVVAAPVAATDDEPVGMTASGKIAIIGAVALVVGAVAVLSLQRARQRP